MGNIDKAGKVVYGATNRGCIVLIWVLIGLGVVGVLLYFGLRMGGF